MPHNTSFRGRMILPYFDGGDQPLPEGQFLTGYGQWRAFASFNSPGSFARSGSISIRFSAMVWSDIFLDIVSFPSIGHDADTSAIPGKMVWPSRLKERLFKDLQPETAICSNAVPLLKRGVFKAGSYCCGICGDSSPDVLL